MKLENISTLLSAGDSLLDYPMIKRSNFGFIPSHGELLKSLPMENFADNVYITNESGIFAGEEILDIVHKKFHEIKDISQHE
jgi:hypothetical protein